jgi:gliding motility-associated-like protein
MVKKYANFLQVVLFFVFLSLLPTVTYAQCAGDDAALTICDYDNAANASINLYSLLGPSATPGGTWSDDFETGGLDDSTGFLNVHAITYSGIFSYTYTVDGIAGCTDNSSTVYVTIGGYTGSPSEATICSSSGNYNLFQAFDGTRFLSPLLNGNWHNNNTNTDLPGSSSSIDVSKLSGDFSFTYTMDPIGTCPAPPPATIYLKVVRKPEAGKAKPTLKICSDAVSNYTNFDLFTMLDGADPNGVWRDVNLRSTGELTFAGDRSINIENIYNRFGEGDYSFTYTVPSPKAVCPSDEEMIVIRIERKLDLTGATLVVTPDICETEIPTTTYAARLTKGPAAIPNGTYNVIFSVSGPNGGTETVTANFTNGILLFPIKSDYFKQVGDFTVTIIDVFAQNSQRACTNVTNNLSDVLHIYPIPDLTGAKIDPIKTCQNADAVAVISNAVKIIDGIYDLRYNISGANTANFQTVRVTFTGGVASFTIPDILNSRSGNGVITITNITHVISLCTNTANLKGNIVINPLPNIANLRMQIADVCFGDAVSASVSGLGNLTDVTLSYTLSGSNPSTVQTIVLNPTGGNASFIIPSALLLNTGTTTATVTNLINNSTTCAVSVSGVADPFAINPIPAAPTAINQEFCKVDGATIANLQPNGAQYKWYDSATSTTPFADTYVLQSGNYWVKVTTSGCTSEPTMITVTINDTPAPVLNTDGQNFCGLNAPTVADLSNNTNVPATIVWYDAPNNGNLLPSTAPLTEQGRYYGFDFSDTNDCLSYDYLEVTVTLTDCDDVPHDFFIPDGFSPNGDGVNDTYVIPNIEFLYPNYTIEIFNRYGNGMYKGFNGKPGWDGLNYEREGIGSGMAPNGVYFYILNFNKDNRPPKQGRLYLNR